jgi:hypothetical protein
VPNVRPGLALLLLLGFLVAGCLAPAPPVALQGREALVRARDEDTARHVAGLLDELVPRARAELHASADEPVEVWVQAPLAVYALIDKKPPTDGFYLYSQHRIHIRESRARGPEDVAGFLLAHELVHQLRDESWEPLVPALEEGLADTIALRLVPQAVPLVRAVRGLAALAATEGLPLRIAWHDVIPDTEAVLTIEALVQLTLTPEDVSLVDELLQAPDVPGVDYGRAFLIVQRLEELDGLAGLHAAARADPRPDVLTLERAALMAGIPLEPEELSTWVVSRMDSATLGQLLAHQVDDVADELAQLLPPDDGDPRAEMLSLAPTFEVVGSSACVAATDVPGLLEAFVERRTSAR